MLNGPSFPPLGPVFLIAACRGYPDRRRPCDWQRCGASIFQFAGCLAIPYGPGLTLRLMAPMEFSMVMVREIVSAAIVAVALVAGLGGKADAAQCGSSSAGLEA